MTVIAFLLSILFQSTIVLFLIALFCSLLARSAYQQGRFVRARRLACVAFGASSLLAVLYLAMCLLSFSVLNIIMAGLWGYFAWRDYQFLRFMGQ